jgi:Domain of unknown function (DUF4440)
MEGPQLHDCIHLEQQGWQALATGPEAAGSFYERVLDHDVVMLLPGGMVLDDRSSILEAMSGQPWSSYRLEDLRAIHPTTDTTLVTYGVVAARQGSPEYSALIASLYARRDGGWRLAFHQQTPR